MEQMTIQSNAFEQAGKPKEGKQHRGGSSIFVSNQMVQTVGEHESERKDVADLVKYRNLPTVRKEW